MGAQGKKKTSPVGDTGEVGGLLSMQAPSRAVDRGAQGRAAS